MISRELLKNEIDGISDEYMEVLYKIVKSLKLPEKKNSSLTPYQLGKDLFGKYGSGKSTLSQDYKKILKEKLRGKRS